MQSPLTGSVGRGGANRPHDVQLIQQCLNAVPPEQGRPAPLLQVDGQCGPKSIAAIQSFQLRQFGWKLADGRVDLLGPTWNALSAIIAQVAPILLQQAPGAPQPLRVWLKNLVGALYAPLFDATVQTQIASELQTWCNQIVSQTKQFSTTMVQWNPPAASVTPRDLLVYFVNEPRYGVLRRPDDPAAGGFTGFLGGGLVMQVYCVDQLQNTLRPASYLSRLAFHEMMHGKIDVGPSPSGRDPKTGSAIRDIHTQGGGGMASIPTPPSASLNTRNRDLMAHNLHLPVTLHTAAL